MPHVWDGANYRAIPEGGRPPDEYMIHAPDGKVYPTVYDQLVGNGKWATERKYDAQSGEFYNSDVDGAL